MNYRAFVSGGTGTIGSRLVESLVNAGWEVIVLARPSGGLSASDRVAQLLSSSLGRDLQRIKVVEGDVTRPHCGLDAETILRLKGKCQTFWHCAADTRFALGFKDSVKKSVYCTNVSGTANALATAKALSIENFCHVSTAFVFGDYAGIGVEKPHPDLGQRFNNPYEESKFLAERLVTSSRLNWMILRPPIVVGDSKTGVINGFSGYYSLAKELWRLKEAAVHGSGTTHLYHHARHERLHVPFDVPGRPDAVLTVASVDFVVDAMVALTQFSHAWHKVYHLVPAKSRTYGWWLHTSLKTFGIKGVRIAEPTSFNRIKEHHLLVAQRRITQGWKPYLPYISGATSFEPTNLSNVLPTWKHRPIDEQFVSLLLKHAIEHRFGEKRPRPQPLQPSLHYAPLLAEGLVH